MDMFLKEELVDYKGIPFVLIFEDLTTIDDFILWYRDNKETIRDRLLKGGSILLKGLNINSTDKLQTLMQHLYPDAKSFLDGNSSRGKYTSNVYNASEYDPDAKIQLHTEFSYSNVWPEMICFCCATKPLSGGQTTIGDSRQVLELLDRDIVEEFSAKGITYIRNLHGGNGLGPSWQEAFESGDKSFVEQYCIKNLIKCDWKKDGSVRLIQTRPAVRKHSVTNELLWFNQVDQFYPQLYGEEVFDALLSLAGNDPNNIPMYARYGNGTEIQKESIEKIIKVLDKITIPVNWEEGDFLLLDNMLSLHGRLAFSGPRKILVSMA